MHFTLLRLPEKFKKNIVEFCHILEVPHYLYQRMPMGLNISPPVWQSDINAILDCLESRYYCEVIMDDLLLFTTSKQSHMTELEDLLKAYLRMV